MPKDDADDFAAPLPTPAAEVLGLVPIPYVQKPLASYLMALDCSYGRQTEMTYIAETRQHGADYVIKKIQNLLEQELRNVSSALAAWQHNKNVVNALVAIIESAGFSKLQSQLHPGDRLRAPSSWYTGLTAALPAGPNTNEGTVRLTADFAIQQVKKYAREFSRDAGSPCNAEEK